MLLILIKQRQTDLAGTVEDHKSRTRLHLAMHYTDDIIESPQLMDAVGCASTSQGPWISLGQTFTAPTAVQ